MIYTREQFMLEWKELGDATLSEGGLNLESPGVAQTVITHLPVECEAEQKAASVVFWDMNLTRKKKRQIQNMQHSIEPVCVPR